MTVIKKPQWYRETLPNEEDEREGKADPFQTQPIRAESQNKFTSAPKQTPPPKMSPPKQTPPVQKGVPKWVIYGGIALLAIYIFNQMRK